MDRPQPRFRTRAAAPYLLAAPFFLALAAFWAAPLAEGVAMSLESDTLYGPAHFVGLRHYRALLGDGRFLRALLNTARHAAASIVLVIPLGLALALLVRRAAAPAEPWIRFALLLPALTPPVVLGVLFVLVFAGRHGLLNAVLAPLGASRLDWLQDPALIPLSLVAQAAWRWTGFVALVLLAGLDGVPRALVLLARAEGAGPFHVFRDVTLPHLRPLLAFCAVFLVLDAFTLFAGAYALLGSSGGTEDAGLLLVGLVYQTAFTYGRFGSAAAMSLAALPILAVALIWLLRERRHAGAV
jgi:ABC-type sugar transport system permease subunit